MSPATQAQAELILVVQQAVARAEQVLLRTPTGSDLEDHRVALVGDMAEALDRIEPRLGAQWMQAMFPEHDLHDLQQAPL